jgi:hypothetical protein
MKPKKSAAKTALKPSVKTPGPVTSASNGEVTTIDVKLDVGYGNSLFLRGEGSGLNWEQGVPLACIDAKTWRWSQEVTTPVTFKVLINDQVWSAGNDWKVGPGQRIEVAPAF